MDEDKEKKNSDDYIIEQKEKQRQDDIPKGSDCSGEEHRRPTNPYKLKKSPIPDPRVYVDDEYEKRDNKN